MQRIETKGKIVGEIIVFLGLQLLMLLFRVVEPIQWPALFPGEYTNLLNQWAYFLLEGFLIGVVILRHIFQIPYETVGIKDFKGQLGKIVGQYIVLGVCIAGTFLMGQFSKQVEINGIYLTCQILTYGIAIAFIKEVLFRGFLVEYIAKLVGGKSILTSILAAGCFAITYVPSILVQLEQVSLVAVAQALAIPFGMGFYLSMLYYYSKNLWLCVAIHGVLINVQTFEQSFLIIALEGIYIAGLCIYLIFRMVKYNKRKHENQETIEGKETELQSSNQEVQDESRVINPAQDREFVKEKEWENEALQNLSSALEGTTVGIENKEPMLSQIPSQMRESVQESESPQNEQLDREKRQEMFDKKENKREYQEKSEESEKMPDLFSMLSDDKLTEEYSPQDGYLVANQQLSSEVDSALKISVNVAEDKIKVVESIKAEPNFIQYLEQYLGEFEGIYKQVIPTEPPIDILYFEGNQVNALVTNGMRGMPMNVPPELKEYQHIELMMFVDKAFDLSNEGLLETQNAWLMRLLTELAEYPRETGSYLGWGHIVGNGEKMQPYDETVKYCGALVYPPMNQQDIAFRQYVEAGVNVSIYNVMPLYKEELTFIQEQSCEQFVNLMVTLGVNQTIYKKRINVIKQFKQSL